MCVRVCGMCLCVCLRGRRTLNERQSVDLPGFDLSAEQAAWLRGARSRLLRRAMIGRRPVIVDLGAGWGIVANELCARTGRRVIALDRRPRPEGIDLHANVDWLVGRAEALPLADHSIDLMFAQFTMMWLDVRRAIAEAARVLSPGGALAMIEPDYGGLMEHPEEIVTKQIWIAALRRAGADPCVGRKLPSLCTAASLKVETRFADRYQAAQPARLDLLAELPLTSGERQHVDRIKTRPKTAREHGTAHLPLWMVLAVKPLD